MKYRPQIFWRLFTEKIQYVAMGFPVMDHHRQIQPVRQVTLLFQTQQLHLPGLVFFPVIIQADLPDGHHFFMLTGQLLQLPDVTFIPYPRQIPRMPAHRRINKIVLL